MPQPELPEPAHAEVDSMLSRKFGREVANYFAGRCSVIFRSITGADLPRVTIESGILLADKPPIPLGRP